MHSPNDEATGHPARWPVLSSLVHRRAIDRVSPGGSIRANHRRYAEMDHLLHSTPGAIRSHWFAAAACVTHPHRGLGTLDGPLGRLAFTDAQSALLRYVHVGLFTHNLAWFQQLRLGVLPAGFEGLRGLALDHAMVDAEQRRFSQLVQQYFRHDSALIDRFMRALSARFGEAIVLRSRLLAPALRAALHRSRAEAPIDMGCEAQRRGIGHALVDRLRAERGAADA